MQTPLAYLRTQWPYQSKIAGSGPAMYRSRSNLQLKEVLNEVAINI